MKKRWLMLVVGLGLLVGCQPAKDNSNNPETHSSTTHSSTAHSSKVSSDSSTRSSTTSSTSHTGTSSSVTPSTTPSTEPSSSENPNGPNAQEELIQLHSELKMPRITPTQGQFINVASALEVNHLSVLYYMMTTPLVMSHKQLNNEIPFASYNIKSYGTMKEAEDAVNYVTDSNGQSVDLGYGLTGYQQGAAGSTYLNWQEGNWSLTVRAVSGSGQEAISTAKEMVEYLEKNLLPAPKNLGQVTVDLGLTGYKKAKVAWNFDETVYEVTSDSPLKALEIAVSVK